MQRAIGVAILVIMSNCTCITFISTCMSPIMHAVEYASMSNKKYSGQTENMIKGYRAVRYVAIPQLGRLHRYNVDYHSIAMHVCNSRGRTSFCNHA